MRRWIAISKADALGNEHFWIECILECVAAIFFSRRREQQEVGIYEHTDPGEEEMPGLFEHHDYREHSLICPHACHVCHERDNE